MIVSNSVVREHDPLCRYPFSTMTSQQNTSSRW